MVKNKHLITCLLFGLCFYSNATLETGEVIVHGDAEATPQSGQQPFCTSGNGWDESCCVTDLAIQSRYSSECCINPKHSSSMHGFWNGSSCVSLAICNDGQSLDRHTNTCKDICPAQTINGCVLEKKQIGEKSGSCDISYRTGGCSYTCSNNGWGIKPPDDYNSCGVCTEHRWCLGNMCMPIGVPIPFFNSQMDIKTKGCGYPPFNRYLFHNETVTFNCHNTPDSPQTGKCTATCNMGSFSFSRTTCTATNPPPNCPQMSFSLAPLPDGWSWATITRRGETCTAPSSPPYSLIKCTTKFLENSVLKRKVIQTYSCQRNGQWRKSTIFRDCPCP